jgi:LPXTG-motif cell wall-anchored protein
MKSIGMKPVSRLGTIKPPAVAAASAASAASAQAGSSKLLLYGAIALLGVGGFIYIRKRRKGGKTAPAPTGETA